ncbi:MAG: hypothetical protein ACK5YW_15720, partial [Betaproteobacteria bacterium]|nr:hypothetical protein [Rhodocyclaceae bacterium]MCA3147428.1 hypothetical protein [Rhodocyclaceae bacterium]MCE2899206.1 hypothetical protein [Betaproteobacteria bacterium]
APRRARRARGEPASPDPGARVVGNLRGAPVSEAFLRFAPIDDIPALRGCALLIIDAQNEELFDLREHGALALERAPEPKGRVALGGVPLAPVPASALSAAHDGGVAFAGHYGAGPCVCGTGAAAGDGAMLRENRGIEP